MDLSTLAMFRAVVGYLGEKEQYGWWQSSFFTRSSPTFLEPVFARTQLLAQAKGVTQAAMLIHDERIGVGNVYHLFRLPEDMERGIHRALHDPHLREQIESSVIDTETANAFLRSQADLKPETDVGPVRIGELHDLRDSSFWRAAITQYLGAFDRKIEVFPYFAGHAT